MASSMRSLRASALVVVGAAFVAVALATPQPALATWELAKATNGVIVSRSADDTDTTPVVIEVFYDYRGGDKSWAMSTDSSRIPTRATAYFKSVNVCAVDTLKGSAVEVPLVPGYRLQMVRVKMLNAPYSDLRTFAVINDPQSVSVVGTPPVSIASSLSLDSSVSVDGTLPVSVVGIGGADSRALGLIVALAAFMIGFVLSGWFDHD